VFLQVFRHFLRKIQLEFRCLSKFSFRRLNFDRCKVLRLPVGGVHHSENTDVMEWTNLPRQPSTHVVHSEGKDSFPIGTLRAFGCSATVIYGRFRVRPTVGTQLFRIIEMPESTSLLVFVVFCAKKVKWRKSVP
jgi:hypothetical protein